MMFANLPNCLPVAGVPFSTPMAPMSMAGVTIAVTLLILTALAIILADARQGSRLLSGAPRRKTARKDRGRHLRPVAPHRGLWAGAHR